MYFVMYLLYKKIVSIFPLSIQLQMRRGRHNVILDWMKNYFCDRLQYVQYNDSYSTSNTIQYGVPQLLLYINDLSNVSNIFYFILFADDTNLFYSHKDLSCLINLRWLDTELHTSFRTSGSPHKPSRHFSMLA